VTERLRVREIDNDEGRRLVRIVRRGTGSVVTWRRAQMVLLLAQGMDVVAVAKVAFTSEDRVRDVIRNFNADGFSSLYPRYKGGHPPKFTLGQRREIKKIAKSRPAGHDLPVDRASDAEIVALLGACLSARDRLIVLLMARDGWHVSMPVPAGGRRDPDAWAATELAFDSQKKRKNYTNPGRAPGQVTSSQQSHLAKLRHTKPGVHETRDAPCLRRTESDNAAGNGRAAADADTAAIVPAGSTRRHANPYGSENVTQPAQTHRRLKPRQRDLNAYLATRAM
jgi:hypothetical protein